MTVNIKPAVDQSVTSLQEAGIKLTDFQKAMKGKRAHESTVFHRISYARHCCWYGSFCGKYYRLFTKYGDGAADIAPIFGLNKRQGRQL